MKVGEADTAGNVLRLSGPNASIFRTEDGGYLIKTKDSSFPLMFVEDAIASYNELNGTYITKLPRIYQKMEKPATFPSSRNSEIEYTVIQMPESMSLVCDCPGFGYRRTCKHVEFLDEFLSEKEQSNEDT